ncbi:uncharacterized protein LOC118196890, partial [Stegodyphus dumicola]|uniref:uncharacterized protein LOC118196890 n=1 Tax=Stegodyphus dumicola TaxID=202533 RepID=UPI0015AB01A6
MHLDDIILCTDSTIALSWLKTSPHLLKTFVANRVSKIQRLVEPRHWKHVSSANNPADLISRGVYSHELVTSSLWCNGLEQNELSDASLFELDKTLIDSSAYQDELKKPLDINLNYLSESRLSRWQKLTKMIQILWKRWITDYLNHLQQQKKWYFSKDNIKKNRMLIIKDDHLPPFKWLLGRIDQTIPRKD